MSARFIIAITIGTLVISAAPLDNALAEESNYEIIKATENVAWRLNKKTGEISACRFNGETMTCASSDSAVIRPKTSFEEFKKEKEKERAERRADDMAMFDYFLAYFKKFIKTAKELENANQGGKGDVDTEAK